MLTVHPPGGLRKLAGGVSPDPYLIHIGRVLCPEGTLVPKPGVAKLPRVPARRISYAEGVEEERPASKGEHAPMPQPRRGRIFLSVPTLGSSFLATQGFGMKSLRDIENPSSARRDVDKDRGFSPRLPSDVALRQRNS